MYLDELIDGPVLDNISLILESEDWSFNALVELAGLDPNYDFTFCNLRNMDLRGADLRNFDFTGADLRGCLRDEGTIIDDSTLLFDALTDWVEFEKIQIVEKMLEVQSASSRKARITSLESLVSEYTSNRHIQQYLFNISKETRSIDAFFDYTDFIDGELDAEKNRALLAKLKQLILSGSRSSRLKQKLGRKSIISINSVLERMEHSNNSAIYNAFKAHLKNEFDAKNISLDSSKYEVTQELKSLLSVLEP